jgi:hypothetical protein
MSRTVQPRQGQNNDVYSIEVEKVIRHGWRPLQGPPGTVYNSCDRKGREKLAKDLFVLCKRHIQGWRSNRNCCLFGDRLHIENI